MMKIPLQAGVRSCKEIKKLQAFRLKWNVGAVKDTNDFKLARFKKSMVRLSRKLYDDGIIDYTFWNVLKH